MWINLSPNLNPNLSPNPSPNLMSSLLNTCLLPIFSTSSRIKLVMIFLFLLVMNILFLVTNILSRIYSRHEHFVKNIYFILQERSYKVPFLLPPSFSLFLSLCGFCFDLQRSAIEKWLVIDLFLYFILQERS